MTRPRITAEDLADLDEAELDALELDIARLKATWEVRNLRGQAAIWHDDQHIGEQRRELNAVDHPSVDADALYAFRMKPVVDSLAGNSLIHPLATPIVEVDETATRARGVWWSLGVEGLSKFQETPMAIISVGIVPGTHIRHDDGTWRILQGNWQRTTKNEYHAGWVRDMQATNTRPPLTPQQDREFLGRYAYRPDEIRQPVPEPPRADTWMVYTDETDDSWLRANLS